MKQTPEQFSLRPELVSREKKKMNSARAEAEEAQTESAHSKNTETAKTDVRDIAEIVARERIGAPFDDKKFFKLLEWRTIYGGKLVEIIKNYASNTEEIAESVRGIQQLEKRYPGMAKQLCDRDNIVVFSSDEDDIERYKTLYNDGIDLLDEGSADTYEMDTDAIEKNIDTLIEFGGLQALNKMKAYAMKLEGTPTGKSLIGYLKIASVQPLERCLSGFQDEKQTWHSPTRVDKRKDQAEPLLEWLLADAKLPGKELIDAWCTHEKGAEVRRNCAAINRIEQAIPGGAKRLFTEFGIRHFCRYPPEILIKQLREHKTNKRPFGVIVNPMKDWNGGYSEESDLWQQLSADIRPLGYAVRVIEGESKAEIARGLLNLVSVKKNRKRKLGKRRISFVILGGHGEKEDMEFGQRRRYEISGKILDMYGLRQAKHLLEKEATIILNSCLTGVEGGLAQKLSHTLDAQVIAPDNDAVIEKITVQRQPNGNLTFDLVFGHGSNERKFYRGKTII